MGKTTLSSRRGGFTLVEILAVILIIGLLAGLLVVAGQMALRFFRGVNAKADLDNVAKALELYKNKYGEYPPDGTDPAAIKRHLTKRDPDLIQPKNSVKLQKTVEALTELAPTGQLLTYWLCGPDWSGPDATFKGKSDFIDLKPGFSKPAEVGSARTGVNYNIDGSYLCDSKGYPIIYFLASGNTDGLGAYANGLTPDQTKYFVYETASGEPDFVVPYGKSDGTWLEPNRFQLILPGDDGRFSSLADAKDVNNGEFEKLAVIREFDTRSNYSMEGESSAADDDNIANFTNGATFQSEFEKNGQN